MVAYDKISRHFTQVRDSVHQAADATRDTPLWPADLVEAITPLRAVNSGMGRLSERLNSMTNQLIIRVQEERQYPDEIAEIAAAMQAPLGKIGDQVRAVDRSWGGLAINVTQALETHQPVSAARVLLAPMSDAAAAMHNAEQLAREYLRLGDCIDSVGHVRVTCLHTVDLTEHLKRSLGCYPEPHDGIDNASRWLGRIARHQRVLSKTWFAVRTDLDRLAINSTLRSGLV